MAIILSVSIDIKQKEFLDELKLSPSALLQRVLNDMMKDYALNLAETKNLYKNVGLLQGTISKQGTFINKHGLMSEYLDFEDV